MDGILNINKEKGYTSHDVVAVVRRTLQQKKVGHTGTLDPDAEGVLPICLGKATRLADDIMAAHKVYRAVLTLGVTTDTEDASGEILEQKPVDFDEEAIQEAVDNFVGEIQQIPPMYSAIKIQGKKLYQLAREGKEIERAPRNVTIHDIKIQKFLPPNQLEMDIYCSKGTYIRTLCADIGKKLGCGGHMASLIRLASGGFKLEDAITLDELKRLKEEDRLSEALIPMDEVLKEYNKVIVKEEGTKLLYNGGKIYTYFFEKTDRPVMLGEKVLGYDSKLQFMGIYQIATEKEQDRLYMKPLKILR
ncbi:MAG: tRNA pseudouridine(55) synthase TruB [Epulopiscium sp.]|nr:tRNA pseudouridine(55) synthase TruB [Candidatus Epulonipiscium sp.]